MASALWSQVRRWWAFQNRPGCTGDERCRAHPGMGAHMGFTYDSWRDYPLREERAEFAARNEVRRWLDDNDVPVRLPVGSSVLVDADRGWVMYTAWGAGIPSDGAGGEELRELSKVVLMSPMTDRLRVAFGVAGLRLYEGRGVLVRESDPTRTVFVAATR